MSDKNRYFIVFFRGRTRKAKSYTPCHVNMATTEGGYIGGERAYRTLKEKYPNMSQIVITNIIELPEADYKRWSMPEGGLEEVESK